LIPEGKYRPDDSDFVGNDHDLTEKRPDEGIDHANAGASQANRGNCPEGATRQISPLTRHASYDGKEEAML
jgi:hypothetical protein